MKTSYQLAAFLVLLAGSGPVSTSYTQRPNLVQEYAGSGTGPAIPYVEVANDQDSSAATQTPTSPIAQSQTPLQVASSSAAPAVSVAPEEKLAQAQSAPIHTPATNGLSSESAEAKTLAPATVAASQVTPAPVVQAVGNGVMTIAITNHWPTPLSISYMDNAGSPGAVGSPKAGPLGTATTVVYPTGWAGRIYLGKTINSADSKIEGSTTGWNDIDVSYVDGYSVPVTCSAGTTPVTGCNIDLWAVSGTCTNAVGDQDVCLNPMQGVANGPSDPWFLPCQGAAYVFPNDNVANCGNTNTPTVSCCIGTAAQGCAAPARQGHGNNQASKREIISRAEELPMGIRPPVVEGGAEAEGDGIVPGAPSLLPHAHAHLKKHLHKKRGHRHGLVHEGK